MWFSPLCVASVGQRLVRAATWQLVLTVSRSHLSCQRPRHRHLKVMSGTCATQLRRRWNDRGSSTTSHARPSRSSVLLTSTSNHPTSRLHYTIYFSSPRIIIPPAIGGALTDTAICLSVCPSPRHAAAVGYKHAGCLQLSHVQTAHPFADRCRSAANRTAISGGHIVSPPPGR